MAIADTARLIASLELQDKFSKPLDAAGRSLDAAGRKTSTLGKIGGEASRGLGAAANNLKTIGVVAAGAIASQVALGVKSLAILAEVKNQTDAVLKSTQGVANITADEVRKQAEALEDLSTVDDKVIQAGQNMLLTFTNIRNEVGEGNDIFNQATETLLDLSVAMGTEPKQAAIQLGKALNDPIKGITALTRVGVAFTDQQKEEITALTTAGKTMAAQKIILAELNKEFGGSAKAFGEGPGAAMRRFGDAVEGAQQALATGFLPLMEKVSATVQKGLADPAVVANIKQFGEGLAGGLDQLIDTASKLPWGAIGSSLEVAGQGAKAVLTAFTSLPPWVQTAVLTGWGLNKLTGGALGNIAGILGKAAFGAIRGSNPATPVFTKEVGLGATPGGPGGIAGGGKGLLAAAGKAIGLAAGAAIAFEVGNVLGHLVFDPTVKPAVEFETSQFDKLVAAAEGDPQQLQRAIDAIQSGLDDMPLAAQILAREQIGILERQRDQLIGLKGEALKQQTAAFESNANERQLIDEAKAGRLAAAHTGQQTAAAFKSLEQRLIEDRKFKPKLDASEFIRLLRRTSEFGEKGRGTAIEQGPKTGHDPFGQAFLALVRRLDKQTVLDPRVFGEINRHIQAAEQVQRQALRQGDVHAARLLQRTIDGLHRVVGSVDRHRPILEGINRHTQGTERGTRDTTNAVHVTARGTQNHLAIMQSLERRTGDNTGVIARKDFSPNVNVTVPVNNYVSISDVIRGITHASVSTGNIEAGLQA
jgi:hypothetical protein